MSLCRNMLQCFTDGLENDDGTGEPLFGNYDLRYGIDYAVDYQAAGHLVDPLDGFDFSTFETWCRSQLTVQ